MLRAGIPTARAWLAGTREEALGRAVARFAIPAAERKLVIEALVSAIEGLVMHNASKRDAQRMMTFLAQRLIRKR